MAEFDWSRFLVRIDVRSSIDRLYDAWATRSGMESWFLRVSAYSSSDGVLRAAAERAKTGDSYEWMWFGWPDETAERAKILDCNDRDLFKFSFGKAGNCTVRIYEESGKTIVELVQDEIPTDEAGKHSFHLGCKNGWTFYMANLKSILEGGIDLRNKDASLQRVLNA